jgi:hypothetical protein
MPYTDYDYPSLAEEAHDEQFAEERNWERTHACRHGNVLKGTKCDAHPDETLKCDGCDLYHCAAHLKDGFCADCDAFVAADIAASAAAAPAIAAPVAIAIGGWLTSYAAIGNGLFVRVGDGKKKRRAA